MDHPVDRTPVRAPAATPWAVEPGAVASALDTDPRRGLADVDAAARLRTHGRNVLRTASPVAAWRRFLAQFRDVLVLLLLAATAISAALWLIERDAALPYEALAILAVVLLNAGLGFVQESRAEAAVAALRALSADRASVVRAGVRRSVPAAELVPGDVVLIGEGDTIPADARVLESTALHVSEAALTGESVPVSKDARAVAADVPLAERASMVFAGTSAVYGRGRAVVTATGMGTEMGRIAGLLETTPDEATPLQRELARTGRVLGVAVVGIAAVTVATILLAGDVRGIAAVFDVLILGVALAVAAVPEGLPAIVTAVLAVGVQRMARRNAIVRRLAAVETLGSATVIATDKTGTLTKNEMTVRVVVTASGRATFTGTGYDPAGDVRDGDGGAVEGAQRTELEHALGVAERANNATLFERDGRWAVHGDPTEGALRVAAAKAGMDADALDARLPRVGEVPFSSERRLMTTIHRAAGGDQRLVVFSKGAPDVLLERCGAERVGDTTRALTDARRAEIAHANDGLADAALRTLAVAERTLPADARAGGAFPALSNGTGAGARYADIERDLVFDGLIGMIDPPRPEAADAVARARDAGIRPLMVTGDHPRTARVIARELGIAGAVDRTITGAELARLSDDERVATIHDVAVYARVDPEHKLRIVDALRRAGEVVAMTGDGVNDAPALKSADIGVAMGITGTDVAKQAADIVLTDDDFASIVAAVEEGRAIFANIRKFLRYLLSSNTGEVLTMFLGVVLAGRIGLNGGSDFVLPLLATQILWINLVTDGPPALALGLDPAEQRLMRHPPRAPHEPVITGRMWRGILLVGTVMAAGTLFVLDRALPGGFIAGTASLGYGRTMAFTTLMLFQVFNVPNARSDVRSAFTGLFVNRWLWGALALSVALQALVVYARPLQHAFGTVPLSARDWALCTAVASLVLWVREAEKLVRRLRDNGRVSRSRAGRRG